ncbi:MAG TPA: MYXO-CTERM sorting domain-containing protein, partial [Polyangia bacterium]|nr:MYXO-CTERM sorting domain-containing protein [Polyangia bacterium]
PPTGMADAAVVDARVDGADPIVGVSVVSHAPPASGCTCATGGGSRPLAFIPATALLLALLLRRRRA